VNESKTKLFAEGLYPRHGGTANSERLENGLNFGVKGDIGNRDAVDGVLRAVGFGEVKEAADVVVLVVGRKKKFRFGWRKPERRKSDGLAELTRKREVEVNELSEGHAGGSAVMVGSERECTAGTDGRKGRDRKENKSKEGFLHGGRGEHRVRREERKGGGMKSPPLR
jgi:hypothetical protein